MVSNCDAVRAQVRNDASQTAPTEKVELTPAAHHAPAPVHTTPKVAKNPAAARQQETPVMTPKVNETHKQPGAMLNTTPIDRVSDEKSNGQLAKAAAEFGASGKSTVIKMACWVPEKTDPKGTTASVSIVMHSDGKNSFQGFLEMKLEKTGELIEKNLLEYESSIPSKTVIVLSFSKDGKRATRETYAIDFATVQDRISFFDSFSRHKDSVVIYQDTCDPLVRSRAWNVGAEDIQNDVPTPENQHRFVAQEFVPSLNGTNGLSTSADHQKPSSDTDVGTQRDPQPVPTTKSTNARDDERGERQELGDLIDITSEASAEPINLTSYEIRATMQEPTSHISHDIQLNLASDIRANAQFGSTTMGDLRKAFHLKVERICHMWAVVSDVIIKDHSNSQAIQGLRKNLFGAAVKKQCQDKQERVLLLKAVADKIDGRTTTVTTGEKSNGSAKRSTEVGPSASTLKEARIKYTPEQIVNLRHRAAPRPSQLDNITFPCPKPEMQTPGHTNKMVSSSKAPSKASIGTYTAARPTMNVGHDTQQQGYQLEAMGKCLQQEEESVGQRSLIDATPAVHTQKEEDIKRVRHENDCAHIREVSMKRSVQRAASQHADRLFEYAQPTNSAVWSTASQHCHLVRDAFDEY